MRGCTFIQESRPIVKLKLLSRPSGSKLVGLWRRLAPHGHKCPHSLGWRGGGAVGRRRAGGRPYRQLWSVEGREGREGPPCGFLAPFAPDGCIIDEHPSSRAAGATGRVQCDGVGRNWDEAFTTREGGFNH